MNTLFIGNLNDRVSPSDLVALLYERFCSYGQVISVKRGGRGIAFVSFKTGLQATNAAKNAQGILVLGKPIRVETAHKKIIPKFKKRPLEE